MHSELHSFDLTEFRQIFVALGIQIGAEFFELREGTQAGQRNIRLAPVNEQRLQIGEVLCQFVDIRRFGERNATEFLDRPGVCNQLRKSVRLLLIAAVVREIQNL